MNLWWKLALIGLFLQWPAWRLVGVTRKRDPLLLQAFVVVFTFGALALLFVGVIGGICTL